MKRTLLFMASLLFIINGFAQKNRNLVITSGTGEPVQVSINDRLMNQQGLKDIRITDLVDNYYNVRVQFINQPRIFVSARLYVPPMSEIVYEVFAPDRRNPRGDFIIKNIYPLDNQLPYYQQNMIFPWGNQEGNPNNGVVSQNGQINININNNASANNTGAPGAPVVYVPDYHGEIGCTPPVTPDRFESMLNTVRNQTFGSSKVRVAKQIIKTNSCMTVNQLVQILRLFDFDDNRLDVAKFAYHYVYDIENYFKVYNVFDFDMNKRKLDNYINRQE